jgi:small conductance mechanosensitive channel
MLDQLSQWTASSLFNMILAVIIIIVLILVSLYLVNKTAEIIDRRFIAPIPDLDRRARLQTLRKAAKSTAQIFIIVIGVLIALGTLGIDIGPALAAAGIIGLAISLGAQTLIKDVIGGLTILLEDEYRVGDTVKIGTVTGEVEKVTLRRTDLRDAEGRLCMVPNGDVRIVANETRDWARALVILNFSYESDLDKPFAALEKALTRLEADPQIKPYLLAAPEIFGWDSLGDWAVSVKLSAKVTASKRDEVARVLRQYAIEALHDAGVPVDSFSKGK